MRKFLVKQLPYDLSGQGVLVLIGRYLKRINFVTLVDLALLAQASIANSS